MKVEIFPIDHSRDSLLKYSIVGTELKDRGWIFVRHKLRNTWELPAGHIEEGETALQAAQRELYEETGAECFTIEVLFDYSVTIDNVETFGRVFFAKVEKLGQLPDFEIVEVQVTEKLPDELTYPEIQPIIFDNILDTKKALPFR